MRFKKNMIIATAVVLGMSIFAAGCSKDAGDKEKATSASEKITKETSKEDTEEMTHSITYENSGEPVTDKTIFGENVYVFSPEDEPAEVQDKIDKVYSKQERNQFGKDRYSILFMPGEYDSSIEINVGYYTTVAGLGVVPTDTDIEKLWCNADWMNHNATCNFWRGAENFSVNQFTMWATSQAVSLRRMNFNNDIVLSDGEGWSSGGFMADCILAGTVYSGSQQQWLSRNNSWRYWEGGVWNMVFVGIDENRIPRGNWPSQPYTRVQTTEKVQEKPFLMYDEKEGFGLFIPEIRTDAVGVSWENGATGTFKGLNQFHIAYPDTDDASTINAALKAGKHILFTPGIYEFDETIKVENPDTIIYGMGLATLVATDGNIVIETADVSGIKMCGLIFEAGNKESETLLRIGNEKTEQAHADNPVALSDLYFRVGGSGSYIGKVESCVTINTNDIIGDNFWVWRADHGANVAWDTNTARNGIIINGDNVIMYGLFVEHFQEYQTIWNGNGGKLYFYQSEIPYDIPNQKAFMSHDGTVNGYSSYKVSDDVISHEAWGIGIYSYNRDAVIDINSAAEVPDVEGVKVHNICSVVLNGNPGISHVINNSGNSVSHAGNIAKIMEYENGQKE